jgi:polyisoprenoid-binding protein YceI
MTRLKQFRRAHPALAFVAVALFLMTGSAAYAAWTMIGDEAPEGISFSVPDAPQLMATGPNQIVYRIDAARSSVGYEVNEKLANQDHSATGSTKGIAGDVLIDSAAPASSQVGEIVVDVRQLRSDQTVRDNRLHHDYLQSDEFPLARFRTTGITGLPATIGDDTDYQVGLQGDLTVKRTTAPTAIDATVRRRGDELKITARAEVKLSSFDIGPISIIGFVSTSDDAVLSFDLTAVDARTITQPATRVFQPSPATAADTAAGAGPSFSSTVQPILERSCASCHNSGGAGSQTWRLDTARDASESAGGLGLATAARYMPPWPASDRSVAFDHSLKLADGEVAAIQDWVKAGGRIDVDPATPIHDVSADIKHPNKDLELRAAEPYQGSTELTNDYRCFILDPKLVDPQVITGYEFLPDKKENVHHALLYRLHGSSRAAIDKRDTDDTGSGYRCFGGVGASAALDPTGRGGGGGGAELVVGWAPGQLPARYPDNSGLRVAPGDFFVVQIHYHFAHHAPPDNSSFAIQLAHGDLSGYDDVQLTTYLAPAEIPCLPDESGPLCDRDEVLKQLIGDYGPQARLTADGLHLLCRTRIADVARLDGTMAHSSCDHRVAADGQILWVQGHMHELGKTFRMTLNPGMPDEKVLLDIPNWDFSWQLNYQPTETIRLKRGDTVRIECGWDRAKVLPNKEPRYVTWNEGTEDEMCFSTIATQEKHTP